MKSLLYPSERAMAVVIALLVMVISLQVNMCTAFSAIHRQTQPSPRVSSPTERFHAHNHRITRRRMTVQRSMSSDVRRPIVAGNWKLNPSTLSEARTLLKLIASNFVNHRPVAVGQPSTQATPLVAPAKSYSPFGRKIKDGAPQNAYMAAISSYTSPSPDYTAASSAPASSSLSSNDAPNFPEVVVFPPFPYLSEAISILEGTGIKVGAQNVGLETKGAYTGEVAPSMIRSLGCDYALLGHSERRSLYGESDSKINQKVKLCLEQSGLNIILCVGETEEEYDNGLLESVVDLQIKNGLEGISINDLHRIVIAYEPVWAIGTGKTATPEQAQIAHVAVRHTLASMFGSDAACSVRIQYGGSVTPDSVEDLMAMLDVDGALVGGASLVADSFSRIVDGAVGAAPISKAPPRELTARECVSTKNVLGESPVWSVRDQALYWISAPEEEVWTWNLKDSPYRRFTGTTLGCVALRAGEEGSIVLAGENAFLSTRMTWSSSVVRDMPDFGTGPTILCHRPEQTEATRPNDGRVDRQGRFVFGMYNNYHRSGASEGENNAGLYRLNSKLELEELLPPEYKYRVSNCICFPSDGKTVYFCDTPTRKVYAFDYPKQEGQHMLSNRRLVYTMPSNLPGGPDGAQIDSEGYIWIALSGAGQVVRVDPSNGRVDIVVHLPVSSPTSCTFGGPDLDELFITTRGPDGGGLYRVKMPFGVKGLPEPEFIVDSSVDNSALHFGYA